MGMSKLNQFARVRSSLNIPRSRFERSFNHKSTCNAGSLIPVFCDEMLPGDTVTLGTRKIIRMSTPLYPVMDNSYCDLFWFFVPNRLVWDNWEEFITGSSADPTDWEEDVEHLIPTLNIDASSIYPGSIYNYLGCGPLASGSSEGLSSQSVNALPLRAYGLIWNEWFRDQNQYPKIDIYKGDAAQNTVGGTGPSFDWSSSIGISSLPEYGYRMGKPLPVAKFHDYFTSALPLPQKNPNGVSLSIGGLAPLGAGPEAYEMEPVKGSTGSSLYVGTSLGAGIDPGSSGTYVDLKVPTSSVSSGGPVMLTNNASTTTPSVAGNIDKINLYADLSDVTGATISTLRMAFQMQRLFERDARSGTRYFEYLQAGFGVTSPDARLQRPEYVYGSRCRINITQVLQTNDPEAGSEASPLGRTGAFSLTGDRDAPFTYSSVEHGYLFGLMCIRTDQTYSQGIGKMWMRKRRFDFYDPVFAHISEQPIFNYEIYAKSSDDVLTSDVFGYQEAWAEYRYSPNRCSGYMAPGIEGSLDVWHYGNDFSSTPTLSPAFLAERPDNIDRTLAVSSSLAHQFIFDIQFDATWVRPMPMYSVPGLIDHF